jgi:asparagine synthase (glutamine-hydrolysing)
MPTSDDPTQKFNYDILIQVLEDSVHRNLSDGLLLSGGLDTAIISYLAVKWQKPDCITVAWRGAPAPDVAYAERIASELRMNHHVHYFGDEELLNSIHQTIGILGSFDPMEIRNSAAIHTALKVAKERGIGSVMTGDGGDELFGGYSFFFGMNREQLDAALKKMSASTNFSSVPLGGTLGVSVRTPFLAPPVRSLAQDMDAGLKIRDHKGKTYGKWVLRQAFAPLIPPEIIWREKAPIEVGGGTTMLPQFFERLIPDKEFEQKKRKYCEEDKVNIRNQEHLYCYEIYRSVIGVPHSRDASARSCPECNSNVAEGVSFCRVCGAYPI